MSSKAKIESAKRTLKDLNKEDNDVEEIEIDTKGYDNNDDENDENASKRFQQEDFDDWR